MVDEQGPAPSPYGPQYGGPQYGGPQYGGPQYGAPQTGAPQDGTAPAGDPYATWYGQPQPGQPGQPGQHGQSPWASQPVWWMQPQTGPMSMQSPTPPRHPRRRFVVAIAAATAGVMMGAGLATAAFDNPHSGSSQAVSSFTPSQGSTSTGGSSSGTGTTGGSDGSGQGLPSWYGDGSGTDNGTDNGSGTGSGSTSTTTGQATTAQQVGVVDINTVIDYGSEQAAGTGMVLTSNGEILTNNHVIDGATSVTVTVVSTGKTYKATVVGDDPTDDVAVLQLSGASGLATAKIGNSSNVAVGDSVTAVGNAGGTGGVPSSATGTVTALNQSLTATDEGGGNAENLTGMIQLNADIQAGDSGGPLYASNGTIIGIDTAASSSSTSGSTTGFAIPISKATSIAQQIESGNASTTVHIGATAFLGVELGSQSASNSDGSSSSGSATISGVVSGSAAAQAGLQAGDTVTAVNGTSIASASDLTNAMQGLKPGQQVTLSWTDSSGQTNSATVTLGSGPAD
jgi:S1-C subfamily serine protease